jgi:hypothetical protein
MGDERNAVDVINARAQTQESDRADFRNHRVASGSPDVQRPGSWVSRSRRQAPRGTQIVSKRCRRSPDGAATACANASLAVMAWHCSPAEESIPTVVKF